MLIYVFQEPKRSDDELIQRIELIIINQNEKIANLERMVMTQGERLDDFSEIFSNELNDIKAVLKPNVRCKYKHFYIIKST